jgi:hypothetical protein
VTGLLLSILPGITLKDCALDRLKMVEAYMQNHKELSVLGLMMETDADKILTESLYRPE